MQVKVTPVKRTAMQYTLPQTAEAKAVRAELRAKLTQALDKGRDVFSPFNTSNSQVDQKWHFGYNVYTSKTELNYGIRRNQISALYGLQ